MAIYMHPDMLDGTLTALKNNATKLALVKTFTINDSFATVMANRIAEVTMASSDYQITDGANTNSRKIVSAAKSAPANLGSQTAGAGNLHFVFHDGVSRILRVVDESTESAIAANQTVNFPTLTLTRNQPTES